MFAIASKQTETLRNQSHPKNNNSNREMLARWIEYLQWERAFWNVIQTSPVFYASKCALHWLYRLNLHRYIRMCRQSSIRSDDDSIVKHKRNPNSCYQQNACTTNGSVIWSPHAKAMHTHIFIQKVHVIDQSCGRKGPTPIQTYYFTARRNKTKSVGFMWN